MNKSDLFNDKPSIINLNGKELIVHFLVDAEGTLFVQYDPNEALTTDERNVYFLGNPPVRNREYMQSRIIDIVDYYGLHSVAESIRQEPKGENPFYFCDRLCEELLSMKFGCSGDEAMKYREDVEVKVKGLRDPGIIEELKSRYPDLKINVLTTASPYQKGAYEKILSPYEGVGVIIANNVPVENPSKTNPKLYTKVRGALEDSAGRSVFTFADDSAKNIDAAKEGGIDIAKTFVEDEKSLTDTAIEMIEDAYEGGE